MANILQLKIFLEDIYPKIWRRFLAKDSISFHQLHNIIQGVMGWKNYHLYYFNINKKRIELPDKEGYAAYKIENSKKVKLRDYIIKEKQGSVYEYDFGDSWRHIIIVERILNSLPIDVTSVPYCLEGERACPPEDCGGTGGYERFIKVLNTGKDPWKENIKELKKWLGD